MVVTRRVQSAVNPYASVVTGWRRSRKQNDHAFPLSFVSPMCVFHFASKFLLGRVSRFVYFKIQQGSSQQRIANSLIELALERNSKGRQIFLVRTLLL